MKLKCISLFFGVILFIFFRNGTHHYRNFHTQPSICQQLKLAGIGSFLGVWMELTYIHGWICSSGFFNQDQTQCCKWAVQSVGFYLMSLGDTHQVLLEAQGRMGITLLNWWQKGRSDCHIMKDGHWVAKLYKPSSWR